MPSAYFDCTDGSPVLSRLTNLPVFNACTFGVLARIDAYENWGDLIIYSGSSGSFAGLEYDSTGKLFIQNQWSGHAYAAANLWTDGYSGWFRAVFTGDGTNMLGYAKRLQPGATIQTATLSWTTTVAASRIDIGAATVFTTDAEGKHWIGEVFCAAALWSRQEIEAWLNSPLRGMPARAADLTYYNDFDNGFDCNVDQIQTRRSDVGGHFTRTGVITTSMLDPGLRRRALVSLDVPAAATPTGDLIIAGSGATLAMAGTSLVEGTLTPAPSGGTVAMAGTSLVEGTLTPGPSGATLAMVGGPVVTGDLVPTPSGAALAMAGTSLVSGDLIIIGSGGTVAMAGTSDVKGTLAIDGSGGAVAMEGTVEGGTVGDLAITGSGGTPALAGTSTVSGTLAADGSGGAVAASGTTDVAGAMTITGSGGTPAILGTTLVEGTLTPAPSGASLAMQGAPVVSGDCGIGGSGGTVAMAGTTNVAGTVGITGSGGTVEMRGAQFLIIVGSGGSVAMLGEGATAAGGEDEWRPDWWNQGWFPDWYGEETR